jgi:hypothetical protein
LVNPIVGGDRLTSRLILSKTCPVSCCFIFLVGDRSFHHKNERQALAVGGVTKILHKIVAVLIFQKWILEVSFGNPRVSSAHQVFDRLVAPVMAIVSPSHPSPARQPQNINFWDRRGFRPCAPARSPAVFHDSGFVRR